jgi:hypothetical protein
LVIILVIMTSHGMVNKFIPVAQKRCFILSGDMALSQTVRNNVPSLRPVSLIPKKDRPRTYNITMRRVHKTIVAVEKQCLTYFCVCVGVGARALACACTHVALIIQHAA